MGANGKNKMNLSVEDISDDVKSDDVSPVKDKDLAKYLVRTFICSDYYIRYDKEQDISKVDTLDDVSAEWHLVADLTRGGLKIIATYNAKTEMLTIRKCGLWCLIPSEFDPIRKFVANAEKCYNDNIGIARDVVKKKPLKKEMKLS